MHSDPDMRSRHAAQLAAAVTTPRPGCSEVSGSSDGYGGLALRTWLFLAMLGILLIGASARAGPIARDLAAGRATSGGTWELALIRRGDVYLVTEAGSRGTRRTKRLSASYPVFSPDGRFIAFLEGGSPKRGQTHLGIIDTNGRGLRWIQFKGAVFPGDYAWNPHRDLLAIWGGNLELVRPTGAVQVPAVSRGLQVGSFAWAPTGNGYAFTVTPARRPGSTGALMRGDVLYAVGSSGSAVRLWAAADPNGIELARYWPNGQGVLFWIDPLHSASLAADGLGLFSLSLTGGHPLQLGATLPYRSWVQPNGRDQVLIVAGPGRMAWSQKWLNRCDVETGDCSPLSATGRVFIDPAGTSDSDWIAWVSAADLRPTKWGVVSPGGLAQWVRTRTLYLWYDGKGLTRPIRVAGGGVFDPEWAPDGSALSYVQGNSVWLWRQGRVPQRLANLVGQPAYGNSYYGYATYRRDFAWHAAQGSAWP